MACTHVQINVQKRKDSHTDAEVPPPLNAACQRPQDQEVCQADGKQTAVGQASSITALRWTRERLCASGK